MCCHQSGKKTHINQQKLDLFDEEIKNKIGFSNVEFMSISSNGHKSNGRFSSTIEC